MEHQKGADMEQIGRRVKGAVQAYFICVILPSMSFMSGLSHVSTCASIAKS